MTNVIAIDEVQLRRESRDERLRAIGRPVRMRNLAGAVAILNAKTGESRAGELKEWEIERLRNLLRDAVGQLAIHDSPEGMIQYATQLIGMYRTGSCSNE
mgnify:CR=1 FL=1